MFRLIRGKQGKDRKANPFSYKALVRNAQVANHLLELSTQKMNENLLENEPSMLRAVLLQRLVDKLTSAMTDNENNSRGKSRWSEETVRRPTSQQQETSSRRSNTLKSDPVSPVETDESIPDTAVRPSLGLPRGNSNESVNEYYLAREYFRDSETNFSIALPKPPNSQPPARVLTIKVQNKLDTVSEDISPTQTISPATASTIQVPVKNVETVTISRSSSQDITSSLEDVTPIRIPPRTTSHGYNKDGLNADDAEKLIMTINDDPKIRAEKRKTAGILFSESELDDLFKKISMEIEG